MNKEAWIMGYYEALRANRIESENGERSSCTDEWYESTIKTDLECEHVSVRESAYRHGYLSARLVKARHEAQNRIYTP